MTTKGLFVLLSCLVPVLVFGQQASVLNQDPKVVLGQLQWVALRPPLLPPRTQTVTPEVKNLVEQLQPGGFILFQENLASPTQLRRLMEELATLCVIPPLFAIDEEGGTVSRLARVSSFQFRARPAAPRWAAFPEAEFRTRAADLATDLRRLGFLVNLAPVADLNIAAGNPMRFRSFGSNPDHVSRLLGWWIEAFQAKGVASVVKHFPGLGTTQVDTHRDFVQLGTSKSEWLKQEGAVFQATIQSGAEFLMIAHVAWPVVTGNTETIAFSDEVLQRLIRDELDFQGLVMTDALDMEAITRYQTQPRAALRALLAGVDIVAMSTQPREVKAALLQAYLQNPRFRTRVEGSVTRQLKLKRQLMSGDF